MAASIQPKNRLFRVGLVLGLATLLVAAVKKSPEYGRVAVLRQVTKWGRCEAAKSGPKLTVPEMNGAEAITGFVPTCGVLSMRFLQETFARGVHAAVDGKENDFNDSPPGLDQLWRRMGAPLYAKLPNYENANDPPRYDAKGLQMAFDLLYVKPTTVIGGVKAQDLYDNLLRKSFERWALQVAVVVNTKGFVDEMLPLLREAMKDREAWLLGFYGQAARELSSGEGGRDVGPRVVGWVLRRAHDGTLKTLTGIIERVLKEYDPSLHRKFVDPDTGRNDGSVAVRIAVTPKMDWSLAIDGKDGCSGCARVRLAPGKHVFEFTGEGESSAKVELDVSAKARDVAVKLQRQSWGVSVESNGRNVDVTLDGILQGKTPLTIPMRFGKHVVATNDRCVAPESVEVTIGESEPPRVRLQGIEKMAELRVDVVDGADKRLDGSWSAGVANAKTGVPAMVPLCAKSVKVDDLKGNVAEYALALEEGKASVLRITPSTPKLPKAAVWNSTGASMLGQADSVRITCPPRGTMWLGSVWGTGPFLLDSAICPAAVYAGRIKQDAGGEFTMRRSSVNRDYRSGSSNGISSMSRYGANQAGFTVEP